MSLTRFMPDRLRRRYFTDLRRLAEFTIIPLDLDADLPVLDTSAVDGQTLEFAVVPYRPRLRVAVASQAAACDGASSSEARPLVIGAVLGLDYDEPKLHICHPDRDGGSGRYGSADLPDSVGPDAGGNDRAHWCDWAARPANTHAIEQCARAVWQAAQRNCEG